MAAACRGRYIARLRTDEPVAVHLADYRPPDHLVDTVELDFKLEPSATRVGAKLSIRRNAATAADAPLRLDGVRLKLVSIAVDGAPLAEGDYRIEPERLVVTRPLPESFTLDTQVEIDPAANTALEGLYMSAGRFCTQCEAEGFRKITYCPDRPDVLSRYTVRIEADRAFPRLLSNGNLLGPALTVKSRAGDNLMLHKALDMAQAGDVIVVDAHGDLTNAITGELMMLNAARKRLGGIVIDGAIRDLATLREMDLPIFAAGVSTQARTKVLLKNCRP